MSSIWAVRRPGSWFFAAGFGQGPGGSGKKALLVSYLAAKKLPMVRYTGGLVGEVGGEVTRAFNNLHDLRKILNAERNQEAGKSWTAKKDRKVERLPNVWATT